MANFLFSHKHGVTLMIVVHMCGAFRICRVSTVDNYVCGNSEKEK